MLGRNKNKQKPVPVTIESNGCGYDALSYDAKERLKVVGLVKDPYGSKYADIVMTGTKYVVILSERRPIQLFHLNPKYAVPKYDIKPGTYEKFMTEFKLNGVMLLDGLVFGFRLFKNDMIKFGTSEYPILSSKLRTDTTVSLKTVFSDSYSLY